MEVVVVLAYADQETREVVAVEALTDGNCPGEAAQKEELHQEASAVVAH